MTIRDLHRFSIKSKYETIYKIRRFVYHRVSICFLFALFIQQTMTRSQTSGGDLINWSWKIRTLYGFLSDVQYFRPEEHFSFYLVINIALACFYSFILEFLLMRTIKKRVNKRNEELVNGGNQAEDI